MGRGTYHGDKPFLELCVAIGGGWYTLGYIGTSDAWHCKVQKGDPAELDPFGQLEPIGEAYTVQGQACTCPYGRNQPDAPRKCKHVRVAWKLRHDPHFKDAVVLYQATGDIIVLNIAQS